jgi:hypothetical protein
MRAVSRKSTVNLTNSSKPLMEIPGPLRSVMVQVDRPGEKRLLTHWGNAQSRPNAKHEGQDIRRRAVDVLVWTNRVRSAHQPGARRRG